MGFLKNKRNFLNLGLWVHFNSFFKMVFIFEFQNVWRTFSTKNFQISIKFFGTGFLTLLPFFSKFDEFSVVGFVLIVGFQIWLDCDDLETRRKGKASLVGWIVHIWGKLISKPCWVYLNFIFPLFRWLCVYAWVQIMWKWFHD